MKNNINRYIQVLLTYVRRPMFWGLAAWTIEFQLIMFAPFWLNPSNNGPDFGSWEWVGYYWIAQSVGSIIFLPAAIGAALVCHVKEQLDSWRTALVPNYRRAHWVVFALIFILGLALVATTIFLPLSFVKNGPVNSDTFVGGLLIFSSLMLISAWWASFKSLWLSLFIGPLMIIGSILFTELLIAHFSQSNPDYDKINALLWNDVLKILPPILPIAFIALLWKLERGGRRRRKTPQRLINAAQKAVKPAKAARATRAFVHRPMSSFLTRSNRRRVSAFGRFTVLGMGIFLAVVLLFIAKILFTFGEVRYNEGLLMNMSLILITITPTITVVLMWRERLPFLAAESLYPATRTKFVREMGAALAGDFILFWLAATTAALIIMAFFAPVILHTLDFWTCLAASAIMQLLAYGAIALTMSLRSWAFMFVASMIILGWMFFPIESAMYNFPSSLLNNQQIPLDFNVGNIFFLSLGAAGLGMVLALVAYLRWRRIELAAR